MSLTTGPKSSFIIGGVFIPNEIALEIFSYLKMDDLGRCCQVSNGWRGIASTDALWKGIWGKIFPGCNFPEEEDIKAYLDKHQVNSREQLEQCIERFINNIQQDSTSTCSFYSRKENKRFGIKIEIKTGSNNTQNNTSEQYLYLDRNEWDFILTTSELSLGGRGEELVHMHIEFPYSPYSVGWDIINRIEDAVKAKFNQPVSRENAKGGLVIRERHSLFNKIAAITLVATIALAYYFNAE